MGKDQDGECMQCTFCGEPEIITRVTAISGTVRYCLAHAAEAMAQIHTCRDCGFQWVRSRKFDECANCALLACRSGPL